MIAKLRQRRAAFTLVELVIVLIVLAILGTVALPRLARSRDQYRVKLASWRIVADLEYARIEAENTSSQVDVNFSTTANSYEIPGVADFDTSGDYTVLLGHSPYGVNLTTADFGGDATVRFSGFGKPDTAGFVDVVRGGATRRVVLDIDSGRGRVQ